MVSRTFVFVARGASGGRIPEGQRLLINVQTPVGLAKVTFWTDYVDEGFESPVPRELWAEARGEVECGLKDAINAYWRACNNLLPALAVAANAPIEDLKVHLGFDATAGEQNHEFFQNFLPEERGLPRHSRVIDLPATGEVFTALEQSLERQRMERACEFYRQALNYLRPGQEALFILFLWMAVEALTKVALRRACVIEQCTEDELVVRWQLVSSNADPEAIKRAKRGLDGEVRRRLIFHGDAACQRLALEASNGFEHGFKDLERVRTVARRTKDSGAGEHVRRALLELLQIRDETLTGLTSGRYAKPRSNWPISMYAWGTFIGGSQELASTTSDYPFLRWNGSLREYRRNEDGTYAASFNETITVVCGDSVQYRPGHVEIWGPETDPAPET